MKRLTAFILVLALCLSLCSVTAFADGTNYAITNGTPESDKETNHGYITVNETAAEGGTVTVTVKPNEGYQLKLLTVTPVVPTKYTVTFDLNGITGTAPDAQTITSGEKATKPADPTAGGYTFGGWYKEATCTNAWDFANDTVIANTTLYAKWKPADEGSYILKAQGDWFKAFSETTTDKTKITDITFCKELPQGVSAENPVNLTGDSENGKVKGYIVKNGENYKIYIVGDYIFGNTDCTQMFSGFKNLTTLNLGHFDTSNVTNMTAMFMTCNALKTLDLSRFDTSSVTNMINMFDGCKALESLNLSKFDTSKVEYMMRMFSTCENLKTLDLSKFNTTSVTTMNAMFQYCSALETIKFGADFDTSKVTTMADMFKDCTKLQSLDLSKFSTSAVERMTNMFQNCETLTTLDLSSFDTPKVTSMNNMFKGCGSLETIGLDGFTVGNETTVEDMFKDCSKLTSVKINSKNDKIKTALGGWNYNESNGAYEAVTPNKLLKSPAPKQLKSPAPAAPETITPKEQLDGTYQFTMPGYAVTVTAEFEEIRDPAPDDDHDVDYEKLAKAGMVAAGVVAGVVVTKIVVDKLHELKAAKDAAAEAVKAVEMPMVAFGDSGDAVTTLQTELNAQGYACGEADGVFGQNTLNAVKAFQTAKGLTADGVVGEQTWGALL